MLKLPAWEILSHKKASERRGEQSGGCVGLHRICFDAARIAYESRGMDRYIILQID